MAVVRQGLHRSLCRPPPLRDAEVQRIVETAAYRLVRLLQQRGILDEAEVDT